MVRESVLLRIKSVLAVIIANVSGRKSNSGFDSVIFHQKDLVPIRINSSKPAYNRWQDRRF